MKIYIQKRKQKISKLMIARVSSIFFKNYEIFQTNKYQNKTILNLDISKYSILTFNFEVNQTIGK